MTQIYPFNIIIQNRENITFIGNTYIYVCMCGCRANTKYIYIYMIWNRHRGWIDKTYEYCALSVGSYIMQRRVSHSRAAHMFHMRVI